MKLLFLKLIIILYLYADPTETVAVELLNSTEPIVVDWITDYNTTQTTRLNRSSSALVVAKVLFSLAFIICGALLIVHFCVVFLEFRRRRVVVADIDVYVTYM